MMQNDPIHLNDLIEQVKSELLAKPKSGEMFTVKEVQIEVAITVDRDVNGAIDLSVVKLGTTQTVGNVQKVMITLQPISPITRGD